MEIMRRRFLIFVISLFSAFSAKSKAGLSTKMKIIGIGPWELEVPRDWNEKKSEGPGYFESSDGTVGCYLKALTYKDSEKSAQKIANDIQSIHERSFRNATKGHWKVMSQENQGDGLNFRSRLDMYDQENQYRVLSLVLASPNEALQVTIHNYLCVEYSSNRNAYDEVGLSLRRAKFTK